MNKSYPEMTPSERIADRIAKNREIEARVARRGTVPKKPVHRGRVSSSETACRSFAHSDVFPPIASVIEALCRADNNFVSHGEVVLAPLADSDLTVFLDAVVANDLAERDRNYWADSMVKWFSQTYTMSTNPFIDTFERHKGRTYRYKLRK
jgi:hypothetical protein